MARVELGFSEAEFLKLTISDLDFYYRRHIGVWEYRETLVGIICQTIADTGFRSYKKRQEIADFGLGPRKRIQARRRIPTVADQVSMVRGWYSCWVKPQGAGDENRREDDRP